ncbi:PREDICTED: alpha-1,2-mannosyltransferase ALG9-like [Acropora digitifera]|uniref:alpha-1,2-mannosyltransferase ALG9-like n=1 Tax=Acropora digitifera TaxID=70779 RepID=UPI00077AD5C9|nr:PREDICTED: alpha-1,2-mannosyltransferase ALG9-like [Acropora digitifera]
MAVRSSVRRQKPTSSISSSPPFPSFLDTEDDELERKFSSYDDHSEWSPRPYTIFKLLLSARLCSAFLSNLSDCDETFNYWEPMHYLMFGSGFQTWEYSPKYAIRSYAYVLLHTIPGKLQVHLFEANKILVFYFLRFVLSITCAACETYFYRGIMKQFGNHVARIAIVFMLFSTGMFISAAAFLPSTFAMYMVLLSYGGWFAGNNAVAVMATAAGALIGWPFSAILGLPIAWDILVRQRRIIYFLELCVVSLILFLGPLIYIDSFYYGKTVVAPLNIVLYNVFGKGGPSLYGVEPWTFYFLNGALNFNVAFPLALLSLPACVFVRLLNIQTPLKKFPSSVLPVWLTLSGMYIWVLIFFTRPHKEERFLFPIYPFFCLFGAVTVTEVQKLFHHFMFRNSRHHYSASSTWFPVSVCVLFSLLSLSRSSALFHGYHAPLDLYVEFNHMSSNLEHPFPADRYINLCVGKEWYRYPSSFFLPSDRIPTNMNDMNKEEPSRFISVSKCDFLVDLATERETDREPNFEKRFKEWEVVIKKPFLDAERSRRIFRAFYIPLVSSHYTTYVNYVLLRASQRGKAKRRAGKQIEESAR